MGQTASSSRGSNNLPFTNVKVFSATLAHEREQLGEKITDWLYQHKDVQIVDKTVTQSSDEAFHCLAIILFYKQA